MADFNESQDKRNIERQQALSRLHENRTQGTRWTSADPKRSDATQNQPLGDLIELVGDLSNLSDSDAILSRALREKPLNVRLQETREQLKKTNSQNANSEVESAGTLVSDAENRRELLQEVISTHFRENIKDWLSINPDLELSSTPIDELVTYQQEVQYRYKVLRVMLDATLKELSHLELTIRNSTLSSK